VACAGLCVTKQINSTCPSGTAIAQPAARRMPLYSLLRQVMCAIIFTGNQARISSRPMNLRRASCGGSVLFAERILWPSARLNSTLFYGLQRSTMIPVPGRLCTSGPRTMFHG
jgi:hypothetical protein